MSLFLGLDVGTQSVRAALVDLDGHTRALGHAPVATTYPHPGWAEQAPQAWWDAIAAATKEALAALPGAAARIAAIGLDATACTVVACADDGAPLRPALLWMDQRAADEADAIGATGDPALRWVGGRVSAEWMLPKALWLLGHEPDTFARAARIVECTDWLMHRLTGDWSLSLNHVTVKWSYARPDGGWPVGLLQAVGLAGLLDKWPERILPLGQIAGTLAPAAAATLGLRAGTPVAQGGIDAYLGMIGMGVIAPGDVAVIVGTSTCHLTQTAAPILDTGWAGCYPDAVLPGLHTMEAGQTATGAILSWFRQHFAGGKGYDALDAEAAALPPGAEGLVVRDDWQGNRSPYKDPHARGVIHGLSLAHGPAHVWRAIYEATACGTRRILEDLEQRGVGLGRVVLGGGGARSELWLAIHADVLGRPIVLTREHESCALGSAMVAAVAAGALPSLADAAARMVRADRRVEPHPERRAAYDDLYRRYVETYVRLGGPW